VPGEGAGTPVKRVKVQRDSSSQGPVVQCRRGRGRGAEGHPRGVKRFKAHQSSGKLNHSFLIGVAGAQRGGDGLKRTGRCPAL
jgi:hypothetical protein